ncbi:MAG: M61 family peptidase [Bacteroidetes bacterium]|nr:M61 family peptidase [Bacteroidota bacterium]
MKNQDNKVLYTLSSSNPDSHFIEIEMRLQNREGRNLVQFYLPIWRPGRYELADYAKNIQSIRFFSARGVELSFEKISKSCWEVEASGVEEIVVNYTYYANQLDAGAAYVDSTQLYVNPVNCCLYTLEHSYNEIELTLNIPSTYVVATGLKKTKKNVFSALSFDQLADSPFIASPTLQSSTYKIRDASFTVWFQGECQPDWEKVLSDFKKFTNEQMLVFGGCPVAEYHFLFQILPVKAYHGVEHCTSTVIALGPGCDLMKGKLYENFLGISSHELFHAWNIKAIRPQEMYPYDFQKENYSRLGYVSEGVTTYYGDLMLVRSGVIGNDDYFKLLNQTLDNHFYNYGRFNHSVADSSFDTWLDGYSKGIPNRKVSIYTEGSLNALLFDLQIRKLSGGKRSLDTVMKKLYKEFALENCGYTEKDFKELVNEAAGKDLSTLFEKYTYGTEDYFAKLNESLRHVGCHLKSIDSSQHSAAAFGFRLDTDAKVLDVAPNSPAYIAGITRGDEVIGVNGLAIEKNKASDWIAYFDDNVKITFKKDNRLMDILLKSGEEKYFDTARIEKLKSLSKEQEEAFTEWLG